MIALLTFSDVDILQYLYNVTPENEICAVKRRGVALKDVLHQSEHLCKLAIENDVEAFKYVKDKNLTICRYLVGLNPANMQYIKNKEMKQLIQVTSQTAKKLNILLVD
jgi:hypothetical protein